MIVGDDYGSNDDEFLFCLRVALGFCHGCVLLYDVEDICNRFGLDVLVLCGIDALFMKFLVRNFIIGAKTLCHEVDHFYLKNSCILIYIGN